MNIKNIPTRVLLAESKRRLVESEEDLVSEIRKNNEGIFDSFYEFFYNHPTVKSQVMNKGKLKGYIADLFSSRLQDLALYIFSSDEAFSRLDYLYVQYSKGDDSNSKRAFKSFLRQIQKTGLSVDIGAAEEIIQIALEALIEIKESSYVEKDYTKKPETKPVGPMRQPVSNEDDIF